MSPEVGLRFRDHTWELRTIYGADYLRYDELAPDGTWNHRGFVSLDAQPTRRLTLRGTFRGAYAYDPVGLAQMGIFPEDVDGLEEVFTLRGRGRVGIASASASISRARSPRRRCGSPRIARAVRCTRAASRRCSARIAGSRSAAPTSPRCSRNSSSTTSRNRTEANAHGLRARARYQLTRHFYANAWAGPALWLKSGDAVVVPEAGIELFGASRGWDMRAMLAHGLGLGNTARPGLNDWTEAGFSRRFARRFELRETAASGAPGGLRAGRTRGAACIGSGTTR